MSERFLFTDDHDALRAAVRDVVADRQPPAVLRQLAESDDAHDPTTWKLLANQLGAVGLAVPAEHGGAGAGFVELGVALEEVGAGLLCGPFLASAAFGVAFLERCAEADRARLLPGIAAGTTIATAALSGACSRITPGLPVTAADHGQDGWTLTGTEATVLGGPNADVVLVPAHTADGIGFFAVDPSAPGTTRTTLSSVDLTRRSARIDFAGAPAERLVVVGDPAAALDRVLDLARTALAVEQVGAASRILDLTAQYAAGRYQFGRPIGSFQAVKHRCATMLLDVETARSAAYAAMWAAAGEPRELAASASLAKAVCSDAFVRVASAAIQLHGGTGFTWEHVAHFYYRRAKGTQQFLGSPDHHRELLAQRIAG